MSSILPRDRLFHALAATPIITRIRSKSPDARVSSRLCHDLRVRASLLPDIMNRRNPTRIELRNEDMTELDVVKKEAEESKGGRDVAVGTEQPAVSTPAPAAAAAGTAPRTRATGLLERL